MSKNHNKELGRKELGGPRPRVILLLITDSVVLSADIDTDH